MAARNILRTLGLTVVATACCFRAVAATLPVRGWLVHWPDRAYLDRVLEAAPRYNINHLELSHDIVMNVDEIVASPERARLIEDVAEKAAKKGIKSYIWAHELNTRDKNPILSPSTIEGQSFWETRREAYRKALKLCPSVSGVVLMFGSSPTEVWNIEGRDTFWKGLSMPGRVKFVTELVKDVVCSEQNRELIVRDFNHSPKQLAWLVEGLKEMRGITILSKPEPQDFQPLYPHSPAIGAYGNTPQILEIDLNGEYWGQSLTPAAQVGYLRYRMQHGVEKGIAGAVGRIDTYENAALGTPSEINLYAYDRLLKNPEESEQAIYDGWLQSRYGLQPGSEPAKRLAGLLAATWQAAKKVYYTQGFWTWKNQSSFPENITQIDRGITGKSTALWQLSKKEAEQRLVHPDEATVKAILDEKAEGVALAKQNLASLASLKTSLNEADYSDMEKRLALAVDLAEVYESIASAYWRVKLSPSHSSPLCSSEACEQALAGLEGWSDGIAKQHSDIEEIRRQAPRLRTLASELRTRLQSSKEKR